jgi:hypothetical protein
MIPRIIAATPVMVPARYSRITTIARITLMTLSMVPIFLVITASFLSYNVIRSFLDNSTAWPYKKSFWLP